MVNEIVDKKDLLKRSWEIADKISKGPNLIYSSIKEVLRETENEKEIPSFNILRSLESVKKVYGSEDLKEGASSFVKKTDPNWKEFMLKFTIQKNWIIEKFGLNAKW